MTMPVYVTFRDLAANDGLETLIRERADSLGTTYGRVQSCRVLVEVPHRRHRTGNRYQVRIELSVPGETIVVSHHPSLDAGVKLIGEAATKAAELDAEARDAAIVIREAFDIARRRLIEHADRLTDKVHARA